MYYQLLWALLFFSTINGARMFVRECNKTLTGPSGVLQFPYRRIAHQVVILNCEYKIVVKNGAKMKVKISSVPIDSANANCSDSYIMMRDGSNSNAPPLGSGEYCGNVAVRTNWITTTSNKLYIRTVITSVLVTSYKIIYEQVPLIAGGIVELSPEKLQTKITSPNFMVPSRPLEYVNVFIAPVGYALQVTFTQFNRTRLPSCMLEEDVKIRGGGTNVSPLIKIWCDFYDTKEITIEANILYVEIYSNVEQQMNFEVVVTAIARPCGETLDKGTGIITSFVYSTPLNKECKWKIIGPPNKRIVFELGYLKLDNSANREQSNFLKISGDTFNVTDVIGTFRTFNKREIVKTPCRTALVEFYSSSEIVDPLSGVILHYTTIDEPCE